MATVNNTQTPRVSEEITLSRSMGLFTITMIGIGGMIGAGIFVLTGIAAGVAGPALVLAFLLNGIVTTFTAMAYAELGSAFPEAGGGYLWVKEGLGNTQGFLAGWMSWFAHAVAGSLYALAFGRFATEIWLMVGLSSFGLTVHQMTLGFMTVIVAAFTYLNYRGASETGTVGNVITMIKVVILGLFVAFGVVILIRNGDWQTRFFTDFAPNGPLSILVAMGLTFIAFEGYEIISQSGEEAIDPKRNIPRAIFIAIFVSVIIYLLVSIAALGATIAPPGMSVFEYLGEQKEVAIVEVAQQIFPFGVGAAVLLFSGLVSTMSALNATTYSSSHVSFAMGRDHNLPEQFARIHPKRHTPHWAVVISGVLMAVMAWLLPIESVAAAADIMFLLLFLQVNVAVMTLRHKLPNLDRGFWIPGYPFVPIIAIVCNSVLAIYLFTFSPVAWYTAIAWLVVGLLAYYAYFSKIEAMEKPKEILMEEVLVSRDYSVVVPVRTHEQARILGQIGSVIARANGGEVLALSVLPVPPQLTLGEGRLFLKDGRAVLDDVIGHAKQREVPVHTVIRLGRDVSVAVRRTVEENASDLLLLGWPGYTRTAGRLFGSVIDPIVDNPPCDIALVRHRQHRPLRRLLVPVAGGPNSRRAVKMAINMARMTEDSNATIVMLHVVPVGADQANLVRAEQMIAEALEGNDYQHIERQIVAGDDVVNTVLKVAETEKAECDLIVVGATQEPLFKNLLIGSVPEHIARRAKVTVIMVKRRGSPLHSLLRQTVLSPSRPATGKRANTTSTG